MGSDRLPLRCPGQVMITVGGHYRLDVVLGSGGFGTVYRAVDLRFDRPVAIKLLKRELMDQEARFLREAELARRLEHPHTVRLLDFGRTDDGTPFLVFELLRGRTLETLLAQEGGVSYERAAQIGAQVLSGLGEAHRLGIVHRDVKPANIFLASYPGAEEFVKVLDFGIAKPQREQLTMLTNTGVVLGTPSYMAPEQVRAEPALPATDIYALGLVLAEALTARVVVSGATPMIAAAEQIADRPVPLGRDVLASPLGPIIQRATQKSLAARYPTTAAMLADLEQLAMARHSMPASFGKLETSVARPPLPPPVIVVPAHASRGKTRTGGAGVAIAAIATTVLVVLAGLIVGFATRSVETDTPRNDASAKEEPDRKLLGVEALPTASGSNAAPAPQAAPIPTSKQTAPPPVVTATATVAKPNTPTPQPEDKCPTAAMSQAVDSLYPTAKACNTGPPNPFRPTFVIGFSPAGEVTGIGHNLNMGQTINACILGVLKKARVEAYDGPSCDVRKTDSF